MTKICRACKIEKSLEEFSNKKESKDGKCSRCLECTRIYTRKHYSANKKYYLKKNHKRKWVNRKIIWEYLKNCKCCDCGETNPLLLEFDHLNDKKYNISNMVTSTYSWESILEEISKCETVCGNCHKLRTYKRSNTWYYQQWIKEKENG